MSQEVEANVGRRREARYTITDAGAVEVCLVCGDKTVPAQLMDLSKTGMRLSAAEKIQDGALVTIRLFVPRAETTMEVEAKVCWASPGVKDGWFVGCALVESLADECIVKLASSSILDRRRDFRQDVSMAAEARSELGSTFMPITLANYSAGGFSAICAEEVGKPGDRIMLKLAVSESEHKVARAKVVWTRPLGDGSFGMGCSFITREDHQQLKSVVDPESKDRWLKSLKQHRPTHWRSVAAAILLIFTAQLIHTAWSRPDLVQSFDKHVMRRIEPFLNAFFDASGDEKQT